MYRIGILKTSKSAEQIWGAVLYVEYLFHDFQLQFQNANFEPPPPPVPETIKAKKAKIVHKCNICDKEFPFDSHLKRHISSVHETKDFQCDTCGKKFGTKTNLKQHIDSVHLKIGLPIHANITKKVQKSEVYFFKNYCHIVSFSQTFLCTSVISPKSVCHCVIS